MSEYRVAALDTARTYLFEASWGLSRAGRNLTKHGMEEDGTAEVGREALGLSTRVDALMAVVREAHEAAISEGDQT
ncbi:hypothetical protein [Promicromonospora sp. NPDC060271]|uniref:hypothetical protein n=1 Tax=Promicromonospora sp. NPDC060271 TaxID=3347089 RepID=UPI00365E210B